MKKIKLYLIADNFLQKLLEPPNGAFYGHDVACYTSKKDALEDKSSYSKDADVHIVEAEVCVDFKRRKKTKKVK